MRDAEAVELALKWFEQNRPFDNDQDKELLKFLQKATEAE